MGKKKKKSTYRNKYHLKTQRDSVVDYIHFDVFLFCRAPGINTRLHTANNPLHYVGTNPNWQMKSNLRANPVTFHSPTSFMCRSLKHSGLNLCRGSPKSWDSPASSCPASQRLHLFLGQQKLNLMQMVSLETSTSITESIFVLQLHKGPKRCC